MTEKWNILTYWNEKKKKKVQFLKKDSLYSLDFKV